jgi:hypothetical protein
MLSLCVTVASLPSGQSFSPCTALLHCTQPASDVESTCDGSLAPERSILEKLLVEFDWIVADFCLQGRRGTPIGPCHWATGHTSALRDCVHA